LPRAPQQRMRRVGVLMTLAADDPEMKARIAVFHQALNQFGWSHEPHFAAVHEQVECHLGQL